MNRTTLAVVIAAVIVGLVAGVLLTGQQGIALADDKPKDKPLDVAALTAPSPVVAAMAYQSQTDYEQDPFDATKLRKTTMQVRRVLIVHQDGLMEVKDAT